MKFGLTPQQLEWVTNNVVVPIERLGGVVWIFGSRARGDHREHSDLDLMVEGAGDYSREISRIREVAEESELPYIVDLVQLKDFAESYRSGYEREKIRFSNRESKDT